MTNGRHRNFTNMYDHVIEKICEAGFDEKLDHSVWMNRDGEE